MIYKVLDVREKDVEYSYTDRHNTYKSKHTVFVIIVEDEEGNRRRFHMYDGYKDLFLKEYRYCGYTGEFDLVVKGDFIEVTETSTWPIVKIVKEAN